MSGIEEIARTRVILTLPPTFSCLDHRVVVAVVREPFLVSARVPAPRRGPQHQVVVEPFLVAYSRLPLSIL